MCVCVCNYGILTAFCPSLQRIVTGFWLAKRTYDPNRCCGRTFRTKRGNHRVENHQHFFVYVFGGVSFPFLGLFKAEGWPIRFSIIPGVPSIFILNPGILLSRKPPEPPGKRICFLQRARVEKNGKGSLFYSKNGSVSLGFRTFLERRIPGFRMKMEATPRIIICWLPICNLQRVPLLWCCSEATHKRTPMDRTR